MATHSSILAWTTPLDREPGGLHDMIDSFLPFYTLPSSVCSGRVNTTVDSYVVSVSLFYVYTLQ